MNGEAACTFGTADSKTGNNKVAYALVIHICEIENEQ